MPQARTWIVLLAALLVGLIAVRFALPESAPADAAGLELPQVAAGPPPIEIPMGYRAVTLRAEHVAGLARPLTRGDRVDVIATSALASSDSAQVSRLLLENVEVLAVGEANARRGRGVPVSLLVEPDDAIAVAAAGAARFSLLARNPEDAAASPARALAFSSSGGTTPFVARGESLVDRIPPGMRAITIDVRQIDGIAGVVRQGDRVDVILTSPFSRFASGGNTQAGASGSVTETRMISRMILQDVEVLATEKSHQGGVEAPAPAQRVTLLVTPPDAERLAVATDATHRSLLRLVGRHADDRSRMSTGGQALADLLTQRREASHAEVVRGGRSSRRAFYK